MFFTRLALFALMIITSTAASSQVRFYLQYRGIPYYKGGATDFSVLTGIKLDPNKELMVGLGLGGRFRPRTLDGGLKFGKSTYSLGFNYYFSRKFYIGADASLNTLKDIISNSTSGETLTGKFFLDYQFRLTYVVFRRLHFGMSTGIVDFTKLAIKTTSDIVKKQELKPDIALSLRLYVFQIKV